MTDLETTLRSTLADAAKAVTPSPDAWAAVQRRSARPRRQRMTVGLSVAGAVIATTGVLVAVVLGFGDGGSKPEPGKAESVERDLTPTRDLSQHALQSAADILQSRLQAAGVAHPTVVPDQGFLRAYVPAASLGALTAVATTKGVLRFRRALEIGSATPAADSRPAQHRVTHAPTLTTSLQRTYDNWNCVKSSSPTRGRDAASDYIVACSDDGDAKYLLAPTAVPGADIDSAAADLDVASGSRWVVTLAFNNSGARAWQEVTKRAYDVNNGQPQTASCQPPKGCNAVAITLDGAVESAPYISQQGGILGGRAEISGSFSQPAATRLASILRYGALPSSFAVRKPAAQH
jgi:preprotein translocase subunit SecD